MMAIGRFARACRLSIKALRYYDEQRLLQPAHVDPQTGYRYYTAAQVRPAIVIGLLRSLGVGIAEIQRLVSADVAAAPTVMAAVIERLDDELKERQRALAVLRQLGAPDALVTPRIDVVRLPAQHVVRLCIETTPDDLVPDTTTAIYALFAELRAAGREPRAPVLCMNEPLAEGEAIRVHACAAIALPAPSLARAEVDVLPAGTFARLVHLGSYESIAVAYHALYDWAQSHGHAEQGLVREVYLNDPADVAPEALLTEVLLPIHDDYGAFPVREYTSG